MRHDHVRDTPRPLWRGLDYGPALVVLDTLDADGRPPTDLPLAWQALEQRFQIAWCPVRDGATDLHRIEDVLETLADRNTRTQVVARAGLVATATVVTTEFPEIVRGLVLVGAGAEPAPTGVRVRRVTGGDLASPEVVAAITASVDAVPAPVVRLSLPAPGRIELPGVTRTPARHG